MLLDHWNGTVTLDHVSLTLPTPYSFINKGMDA